IQIIATGLMLNESMAVNLLHQYGVTHVRSSSATIINLGTRLFVARLLGPHPSAAMETTVSGTGWPGLGTVLKSTRPSALPRSHTSRRPRPRQMVQLKAITYDTSP